MKSYGHGNCIFTTDPNSSTTATAALSSAESLCQKERLHSRRNSTRSQRTLHAPHMVTETLCGWVWLSVSLNIERLGRGLVWAQWAIWHFEEALSLGTHRAAILAVLCHYWGSPPTPIVFFLLAQTWLGSVKQPLKQYLERALKHTFNHEQGVAAAYSEKEDMLNQSYYINIDLMI